MFWRLWNAKKWKSFLRQAIVFFFFFGARAKERSGLETKERFCGAFFSGAPFLFSLFHSRARGEGKKEEFEGGTVWKRRKKIETDGGEKVKNPSVS